MDMQEFTKSGAFAALVLVLVVVLVPFGLEEIGEATGLFAFPAKKTVVGWFSLGGNASPGGRSANVPPVDWERYRQDLADFTAWAERQGVAVVAQPLHEVEVIDVREDDAEKPERQIWHVPVVSCTSGGAGNREKGYVFVSGFDHPLEEGSVIAPSETLCGYEIVFVGERSVWLRAVFENEGDVRMGRIRFPEFTRVEGESLVRGLRKYVARDAFPLASGGWLMIDSFRPPDGVLFKILDENRHAAASILCIVIGEKGGSR